MIATIRTALMGISLLLPAALSAQLHPVLQEWINATRAGRAPNVSNRGLTRPNPHIIHRGLFRSAPGESSANADLPENSLLAYNRGEQHPWANVIEIDVRNSKDNVAYNTHDLYLARTTTFNGLGLAPSWNAAASSTITGVEYPGRQRIDFPTIGEMNAAQFDPAPSTPQLKAVTLRGSISLAGNLSTLDTALAHIDRNIPNLLVILDIQNLATMDRAAALVRKYGLQGRVILKFWVRPVFKDIVNATTAWPFNNPFARWGNDLWYIPEISHLQLTNDATWKNASASARGGVIDFDDAESRRRVYYSDDIVNAFIQSNRVVGLGLFKTVDNGDADHLASIQVLYNKFKGKLPLIGVLRNPDLILRNSPQGGCRPYTYSGGVNDLIPFVGSNQVETRRFARAMDYQIVDFMHIASANQHTTDWETFVRLGCE